jgi:tetratricopeptide (TPR) repeat protein
LGGLIEAQVRPQEKAEDRERQAEERFEAGQNAHEAGDLKRAIELYGEALQLDEALWQAEYQRGMAWFALGDLSSARASLTKIESRLLPVLDTPEGAEIKPVLMRIALTIAHVWRREGRREEAAAAYQRALVRGAPASQIHLSMAEMALEASAWQEAIRQAKEAIATGQPGVHPAWAVLGLALIEAGQEEEGLPVLARAIELNPNQALLLLRRRADLWLRRKEFGRAIPDLREVVSKSEDQEARQRLAWALWQNRDREEALDQYRQVLNRDTTNRQARMAVATLLIELERGSEAVGELETLVKAEPNRPDLQAQLADLLVATEPERALNFYLAAIRLEPERVSHRIGLGSALVRLRRMAEAVPVLRQSLQMNPSDEKIYYAHTNLATALFELNDFAGALEEFRWILAHQADATRIPVTLYFLAICQDRLEAYQEALVTYEQFLQQATRSNQLEIEKVQLRLPSLRKQIRDGKGRRK